jgi:hypothetical protein
MGARIKSAPSVRRNAHQRPESSVASESPRVTQRGRGFQMWVAALGQTTPVTYRPMTPVRVLVRTEPSKPESVTSLRASRLSKSVQSGVMKPTPQPWSTRTKLKSCIPHGGAGKRSQGSADGVLAAATAPTGMPGTAGTGSGEAEVVRACYNSITQQVEFFDRISH